MTRRLSEKPRFVPHKYTKVIVYLRGESLFFKWTWAQVHSLIRSIAIYRYKYKEKMYSHTGVQCNFAPPPLPPKQRYGNWNIYMSNTKSSLYLTIRILFDAVINMFYIPHKLIYHLKVFFPGKMLVPTPFSLLFIYLLTYKPSLKI